MVMALDALLARLNAEGNSSVTSRTEDAVTRTAASALAGTAVTSVTSSSEVVAEANKAALIAPRRATEDNQDVRWLVRLKCGRQVEVLFTEPTCLSEVSALYPDATAAEPATVVNRHRATKAEADELADLIAIVYRGDS